MPGGLTWLMALSFCVSERSSGKYSGWEQAVGFMAGCTGFHRDLKTFFETFFQTRAASVFVT